MVFRLKFKDYEDDEDVLTINGSSTTKSDKISIGGVLFKLTPHTQFIKRDYPDEEDTLIDFISDPNKLNILKEFVFNQMEIELPSLIAYTRQNRKITILTKGITSELKSKLDHHRFCDETEQLYGPFHLTAIYFDRNTFIPV